MDTKTENTGNIETTETKTTCSTYKKVVYCLGTVAALAAVGYGVYCMFGNKDISATIE